MRDLFGQEPVKIAHINAYAGTPGRGPADKQCRHCACFHRRKTRNRTYYKCGRVKMTAGEGTDIRAKSPACQHFQENR